MLKPMDFGAGIFNKDEIDVITDGLACGGKAFFDAYDYNRGLEYTYPLIDISNGW